LRLKLCVLKVATPDNEPKSEVTREHQEQNMETEFKSIVKDNIATAAVLAATFITIVGAAVESVDVRANYATAQLPAQQMETITVTAPRAEQATLERILVTASRDARTLVVLN
jgi:hypothetical protein